MTGTELLNEALMALGYTDSTGRPDTSTRILSRAKTSINTILDDLQRITNQAERKGITNLCDTLPLPDDTLRAASLGVAMMIAQGESDGDQQQLYSYLYNKQRTLFSSFETARDSIEVPTD